MERLCLLEHLESVEGHAFYGFDSVKFPPPNLGDLACYPFTKFILVGNEKN